MGSPWWKRALAWLRRLVGRSRQRRLTSGGIDPSTIAAWGEHVAIIPDDVRAGLPRLSGRDGVVKDTVVNAIDDFGQLHAIVGGPGATIDAVFDATLLADAEILLRGIVEDAPGLEAIIMLATRRRGDIKGRSAAGVAILQMRDRAALLTAATSAALQWAAEPNSENRDQLEETAAKLGTPTD